MNEMTESNAEFIARMKEITTLYENPQQLPPGAFMRLIALAEERVMIEEHRMGVHPFHGKWDISTFYEDQAAQSTDLSTALRSVVAKIGKGK